MSCICSAPYNHNGMMMNHHVTVESSTNDPQSVVICSKMHFIQLLHFNGPTLV